MIVKKNFSPTKVISYIKFELVIATAAASTAWAIYEIGLKQFFTPFSVAVMLGSALAIFIAFRNNTSYSRWWEARSQWSAILNASRVFARLVITFTDSHKSDKKYSKTNSEKFKVDIVNLLILWTATLKYSLRDTQSENIVKTRLSKDEYERYNKASNKLNFIMMEIGNKLYEAMNKGILAGFDSFQIEGQILALQNSQGALERIKSTPLLRQYHYFTKLFLYVFIGLLPFALISDLAKNGYPYVVIPLAIIISSVYAIIAKVGEVNEDPFDNRITDIPMDYITNTIERDLLEMLGAKNLPEKIKAKDGYLQ